MKERVDEAHQSDLEELADLLHELFSQEVEFSPEREKQVRGLVMLLENPTRGRIFVLRSEGRILAMATVQIVVSTALGDRVGLLEDMVVRDDSRNRGCGGKLLDHVLKWAKREGLLRITLLTDSDNSKAIRFYSSVGFNRSMMIPMRFTL